MPRSSHQYIPAALALLLCTSIGVNVFYFFQHRAAITKLTTTEREHSALLEYTKKELEPLASAQIEQTRTATKDIEQRDALAVFGVTTTARTNGGLQFTASHEHFTAQLNRDWVTKPSQNGESTPFNVTTTTHLVSGLNDIKGLTGVSFGVLNKWIAVTDLSQYPANSAIPRAVDAFLHEMSTTNLEPYFEPMVGRTITRCKQEQITSPYRTQVFSCGGDGGGAYVAHITAPSGRRWIISLFPATFTSHEDMIHFLSTFREHK